MHWDDGPTMRDLTLEQSEARRLEFAAKRGRKGRGSVFAKSVAGLLTHGGRGRPPGPPWPDDSDPLSIEAA
jgi:hypothetical protein